MVVTGSGVVKAVNSGDSVILMGKAKPGSQAPEQEVSLQFVEAPKLARREGQNDEPFAWQSREFLRNLLIGKTVTFKLDRAPSDASTGRAYGDMLVVMEGRAEPQSVLETCLKEGWVKLRNAERADSSSIFTFSALVALESAAKSNNKGLWNEKEAQNSIRKIVWNLEDPEAYAKKRKGKKVDGVLEYVRDANSMRVIILPTPGSDAVYTYISLHLTGIQAPAIKKEGEVSPPYALEAKHQVEALLLHRNVFVEFDGMDKYNNFMASLSVTQGNMAVNLLKNGLARIAEWSIAMCSDPNALRLAERQAMTNKLRLWKEYTGPTGAESSSSQGILGRVVEVQSGDTLVIRKILPNEHADPVMAAEASAFYVSNESAVIDQSHVIRITLSSIRAPRMGRAPRPDEEPTANEPYAVEARDLLRRKAVGKRVVVQPEYSVEMGETKTKRDFGSVFVVSNAVKSVSEGQLTSDNNLAVILVEAGLVTVTKKKPEDLEKSRYIDDLLVAETSAQQKSKGIHSKKESGSHPVNDVSRAGPGNRARQFLPFLLRSGRQRAIVEYLANGARMKLFIPKESLLIFNGVRCPSSDLKSPEKSEPLGRASYAFARDVLLHQEVEVEISSMDKYGTFFVRLAETGLGYIDGMHVDTLPFYKDLEESEGRARAAGRGLWALKEFQAVKATQEVTSPKREREIVHCFVASVIDGVTAYVQEEDSLAEMLNNMSIEQNKLVQQATDLPMSPRKGEYCIVQLEEGWQRARCDGPASKSGVFPLHLIDIGLRTNAPPGAIRPLPAAFSVTKIPPHAMMVKLAYVRLSKRDDDAGAEAADIFREYVHDQTGGKKHVIASIEYKSEDGCPAVVLLSDNNKPSLNEVLLTAGTVKLDKRAVKRADETRAELMETLATCEAKGRQQHVGIYKYGDPGDSEEDEREEAFFQRRKGGK